MKLAIVGEAWGEHEAELQHPFVGVSGLELGRLLCEAGIVRNPIPDTWPNGSRRFVGPKDMQNWWLTSGVHLSNVLNLRPANNNFDALLVPKAQSAPTLPPIRQGKYFPPSLLGELVRLSDELTAARPNLILAVGAVPTWALLGTGKIGAVRGTVAASRWGKVLPTFHPSAVLRNWSLRTVVLHDLEKARLELAFPEIRRPEREVLVEPTLEEARAWIGRNVFDANPALVASDIETDFGQISCIGFATSANKALVIPFVDKARPEWSYWGNAFDEKLAWELVKLILEGPWPKVFQNGLFDLQYILSQGIRPRNVAHDTMLLHHSIYSELQKGLGFLGSIYTNEASWKLLRHRKEELKRDD